MIGSHKMNACATSYMEPGIYEEPAVLCVSLCMAYITHLQAFMTQLRYGNMANSGIISKRKLGENFICCLI